jgi:hypothetical protein
MENGVHAPTPKLGGMTSEFPFSPENFSFMEVYSFMSSVTIVNNSNKNTVLSADFE